MFFIYMGTLPNNIMRDNKTNKTNEHCIVIVKILLPALIPKRSFVNETGPYEKL